MGTDIWQAIAPSNMETKYYEYYRDNIRNTGSKDEVALRFDPIIMLHERGYTVREVANQLYNGNCLAFTNSYVIENMICDGRLPIMLSEIGFIVNDREFENRQTPDNHEEMYKKQVEELIKWELNDLEYRVVICKQKLANAEMRLIAFKEEKGLL